MLNRVFALAVIVLCAGGAALAEEKLLALQGKVIFEDDFGRSDFKPKWRLGKGAWSINDGAVTGAEKAEDNHGAYAYIASKFKYADIVAEYSFKFDGAKAIHFMVDDLSYKGAHAGHICRATITPTSVNVGDSKFGSMKNEIYEKLKDPNIPEAEKKQLRDSIKDKTANFKAQVDPGVWHKAGVEIAGDEMLLIIDGKPVGYIKSEGVGHPIKGDLGFTIAGQTAQLDNVKIYNASPNPAWASRKAAVIASLGK